MMYQKFLSSLFHVDSITVYINFYSYFINLMYLNSYFKIKMKIQLLKIPQQLRLIQNKSTRWMISWRKWFENFDSQANFSMVKIIKCFWIFSKRILDENSRLRRDLEQYKAATDRVGDENALSQNEAMTCESLLEIFIRIEKF